MDNTVLSGASPTEIQAHYDVSNDFYQLWLDPGLVYSAALWDPEQPEQTLYQAQIDKLTYHLRQAQAQDAEFVLDIGCGWGALLKAALKTVKRGVGLTLSEAQKSHIDAQALAGAEIRLESWENYTPPQAIDAIISIGAFEHFARPGMSTEDKHEAYSAFFKRCAEWLTAGGRLSLQTIGYGFVSPEIKQKISTLNQAVFPGSELPTLQEIISAAEPYLEMVQIKNDRLDYAKTCQVWRKNLRAHKALIESQYSAALYKRYNDYLIASEMGFRSGNLNLYRITLEKPKHNWA